MSNLWTVFQTKGDLEIRSLTMFGVTSKPRTDNPIGRFGTGLKYAIAILLREKCEVVIHSPRGKFTFATRQADFRGSDIQEIVMTCNGVSTTLPFTLHLGSHWELWQAYRELESNTKDENGVSFVTETEGVPDGVPGFSLICVNGEKFCNLAHDKGFTFLKPAKLLAKSDYVEIYEGMSPYVYYRGVRAKDLEKPSACTYNILSGLDLTEDRTIKSEFHIRYFAAGAIARSDNEDLISSVLRLDSSEYFEGMFDWVSLGQAHGETFLTVLRDLYIADSQILDRAKQFYSSYMRQKSMEREVCVFLPSSSWKLICEALRSHKGEEEKIASVLISIESLL